MSFLRGLFGLPPSSFSPLRLEGDGSYSFEVVGESHYQDALSAVCGGHCEEGHDFECTAELVPEPTNRYDPNAVMVRVQGNLVAYLAREDAVAHHEMLRGRGKQGAVVICDARINGGWQRPREGRPDDRGMFGVELDI